MLAYIAQGTVEWDMRFLIASVLFAVTITSIAIHVSSRDPLHACSRSLQQGRHPESKS
ncbi:MHYT domain-containing protein [Rhizobium mongolense]|uniref:MHYT domain-containing protein n=1 Tax=Rhizobium mongolense TaxID=57676 RepID=UPI000A07764D|nr:MHYT domain-containing protein [Rhizobium mongolense]